MRTRYDSNGGQLRLCAESKKLLNLGEPSQWRLDNLVAVQPDVIAPLLKYWSEHILQISPDVLDTGRDKQGATSNIAYLRKNVPQRKL